MAPSESSGKVNLLLLMSGKSTRPGTYVLYCLHLCPYLLCREIDLKRAKKELLLQLKERELANEEEINNMRQQHDKNLTKLREEFNKTLNAIQDKYEVKVEKLRGDLMLRRKVEIHEIEERKNLHINDLVRPILLLPSPTLCVVMLGPALSQLFLCSPCRILLL